MLKTREKSPGSKHSLTTRKHFRVDYFKDHCFINQVKILTDVFQEKLLNENSGWVHQSVSILLLAPRVCRQ
jgi:hypothetical protein